MNASERLLERKELFNNAIQFKHNKRVPLFSNYWTWKIFDSGYNLNEAMFDYSILEKTVRNFIERYEFDAYQDIGTRNGLRVSRAVGGGRHKVDSTGEYLEAEDKPMMLREEYGELIAGLKTGDTNAFYWSKVLPRLAREGVTVGEMINGVQEMLGFQEFLGKMIGVATGEYGVLIPNAQSSCAFLPFESLFNTLRGIKESSMDIRKCKSQLKEYLDVTWQGTFAAVQNEMKQPSSPIAFADGMSVMLGHSVLNLKQFEELYWPYLKQAVDCAHENGKTYFMFCEAGMLRFADFLEELPKDTVLLHLEQDNVFEFRKRLPNIAIAGGMPADLLGNGTKQECVNYARKLVDELGDGYVFSTDKMMSYRNDGKSENVLAVNEFLKNYSL